MAEWTAALERWCEAQPGLLAFTGQCAVHRGQLLRVRGAWDDALHEYARAAERYVELGTPGAIGLTAVETGDVLRLRGDLAGSDAAYRRAADLGVDRSQDWPCCGWQAVVRPPPWPPSRTAAAAYAFERHLV